jgi:hypothetical protein
MRRRASGEPGMVPRAILLFVLLGILAAVPVQAQVTREHLWITNGVVYGSALYNNVLYIGGAFTRVGPNVGRGTQLDPGTGLALESAHYAKANLPIYCVEPDGTGGWFVGGVFTVVRGQSRNYVAHFDASGNLTSWNPNLTGGPVNEMHLDGGTLYLAGSFSAVGGQPRNGFASVDAVTGAVTGFNPSTGTGVYDIAVSGGTVYACGSFVNIGGQARNHLAALDAVTGNALPAWNPNPVGDVYALTIAGGSVIIGGSFTNVGGQSRNGLAALGLTGTGSATSWNPQIPGTVEALTATGATLYVGGNFTTASGQPRSRLAAYDLGTGLLTGWDPVANGPVSDLAEDGGIVFACGNFTTLDGFDRRHIGAIDAGGTVTLFQSQLLQDVAGTIVYEVAAAGGKVYAGGDFAGIGAVNRNNLAAFDVIGGQATLWDPNANGAVRALHLIGTNLYIGGDFTALAGVAKDRLAALHLHTGALTNPTPGVNGTVYALTSFGNTLYIGGEFTAIGAGARTNLGSFDMSGIFVTGWNPIAYGGPVRAMRIISMDTFPFTVTLYVGGQFTKIGGFSGTPRSYLAAFDGTVLSSWAPSANFPVYSMLATSSFLTGARTIYVGGSFTTINGFTHNRLAAIDGAGTPTAWTPTTDGTVYALSFAPGGKIYVGGTTFTVNGVLHRGVACLDRATGNLTSWDWDAGNASSVHSLLFSGSTLYVGGSFSGPANQDRYNLAAVSDGAVTAVEDEPATGPAPQTVLRPAPNPFGDRTSFRFALSRTEVASAAVYDVHGRLVRQLHDGVLHAGPHEMEWSGMDRTDRPAAPGVYFVRVRTPSLNLSGKVYRMR